MNDREGDIFQKIKQKAKKHLFLYQEEMILEWHSTGFEFMVFGYETLHHLKDRCEGSGLNTCESSPGSHPFL